MQDMPRRSWKRTKASNFFLPFSRPPTLAVKSRGKRPRLDQSFIISLLLLVDPDVTDIERRAMETSL